mmetsp:Transcript_127417/g.407784  ORF Transcript_127417/g.407784 Transcript_127417/m.407784 type:complete len:83 (-) Transcript_127417:2184-2432(-)
MGAPIERLPMCCCRCSWAWRRGGRRRAQGKGHDHNEILEDKKDATKLLLLCIFASWSCDVNGPDHMGGRCGQSLRCKSLADR